MLSAASIAACGKLSVSFCSQARLLLLREYIARGIEIYTLDLNRPILERLAAAPHERLPDDLARAPRKPRFHIISARTLVGSGATRMEIIPLRTVSGERQMIVYFPETHVLYTSDLFSKLPDGSFWLPQFVQELKSVVDREHLEVWTIFGMHYEPPLGQISCAL